MKRRSAPLLAAALLLPRAATATITISTTGKQYHSRPASFGFELEYGLQYVALAQVAPGDPHLCGGAFDRGGGYPGAAGAEVDAAPGRGAAPLLRTAGGRAVGIPADDGRGGAAAGNATEGEVIHVVPSHGVPVAILAKRGRCSYEDKARAASRQTSPHGAVRFVIVYDDVEEGRDGEGLITMNPGDGAGGGAATSSGRRSGWCS